MTSLMILPRKKNILKNLFRTTPELFQLTKIEVGLYELLSKNSIEGNHPVFVQVSIGIIAIIFGILFYNVLNSEN